MPDTYTSQFSGEEIDSALRAAQIISGAETPAALREKLEIYGSNTALSPTDPTTVETALKYRSNPNLLDNWFFGRPVNQRGKTEYTENWKYGIDRWLCAGDGKVTIADGHCVFYGAVDQGLSVQMSDILGCTMTASLLLADGTLLTGTAVNTDNSIDIPFVSNVDGMYLSLNATDLSGHRRFRTYSAPERAVLAAKLELGSTQTLAHKENGVWVLNEIPDFGEQLRRCQWYCRVYKAGTTLPCLAYPQPDGGWYASAGIPTNGMRTIPTNNLGDGKKVAITDLDGTDATHDDMSMMNWGQNEYMLLLRISGGSHGVLTSKFPYWIKLKEDLILSADL